MKNKKGFIILVAVFAVELIFLCGNVIYGHSLRKTYIENAVTPGTNVFFEVHITECEKGFLEIAPTDEKFLENGYLVVANGENNIAYISCITKKKPSNSILYIKNTWSDFEEGSMFEEDGIGYYSFIPFATDTKADIEDCYSTFKDKKVLAEFEINDGDIFVKGVTIDGKPASQWLRDNGYAKEKE